MSFLSIATLVGALAASASAHGIVTGVVADGTYVPGFSLNYYYQKVNTGKFPESVGWYAENLQNEFISPSAFGTSDIACHKAAEPAKLSASVKAGGNIDFQWSLWPESHRGPVITYAAKCDADCSAADKTKLKFVKIDEAGYNAATQKWATHDLIANNNTWSVKVPSALASGNYVFRHEIIALHGGGNVDGAQNYPQCINVAITGGGSASPVGTVATELYKANDPGVLVVGGIYNGLTSYTIPGPALFDGSSSGGSQPPVVPAPASTAAPATTAAPTTTAAPVSTSAPSATSTIVAPVEQTTAPVATASAVPTTSAAPVPTATPAPGTGSGSPTKPSKPLPAGFTADDLVEWATYFLKQGYTASASKARRHARDVRA